MVENMFCKYKVIGSSPIISKFILKLNYSFYAKKNKKKYKPTLSF
jgi:hypothetical protein